MTYYVMEGVLDAESDYATAEEINEAISYIMEHGKEVRTLDGVDDENDTEVSELATNINCPYCGAEWQEYDMSDCGTTYELECGDCEKEFKMYFDAS